MRAAALDGEDPAQRALEVGLVLHVQAVELLRREHLLDRPSDSSSSASSWTPSRSIAVVGVDVAPAKRLDLVGDLGQPRVDPLGAFMQLVAVPAQLLAVPVNAPRRRPPNNARIAAILPYAPLRSPDLFGEGRNDLEQVADHEEIGEFADRRVRDRWLIAITCSAVCIPTRCWIAPLIPAPM